MAAHRVVHPLVLVVNLAPERLGVQVDLGVLVVEKRVELRVHESDDLGALVVDDRLSLLVPQDGNGEPAAVVGVDAEIELAEELVLVERVARDFGEAVRFADFALCVQFVRKQKLTEQQGPKCQQESTELVRTCVFGKPPSSSRTGG